MTSELLVTAFDGTSMLPVIRPGDRILWRRLGCDCAPGVGDVVGRFVNDRLVAHRLVALIGRESFLTQGDACPFADLPCSRNTLALVAVAAWRRGRPIDLGCPSRPVRLAYRLHTLVRGLVRDSLRRLFRPSSINPSPGGSVLPARRR